MNGAPPRPRIERICTVLLAILVLATLLGYAGAWSWFCDLFAHFRVQYCVLGSLLAIGLGTMKRPALVAMSVLATLANLPPIVPQFVGSALAAPDAAGTPIRVLSFNVFKDSREYQ